MTRNAILFSSLATLSLSVLSLGACNTFDPNLGAAPFRCGTGDPRCPDGYECISHSPSEEICERIGTDPNVRPDGGGGGSFTCNDDSQLEPNNSIADPTLTGIPGTNPTARIVGLALCPSGDNDFFRFEISANATDALVEVEYDSTIGTILVEMVNSSGVSIGEASPVAGNMDILRVTVPNLAQGTYYGQVRTADPTVQNNYSITIVTQQ